ncbi:MAG: dihydroxyacetone kinase subunit L [Lachnospiraceae bacterium]|nr:dihydroxyacetone kinase subunit L [Lachnospiraceae bacterium]
MTDKAKVIEILKKITEKINAEASFLTELDAAIGDNDHGVNLARGFNKVSEKLPDLEGKDIGTILKQSGMSLVSAVGGSSGPLYGQAFMNAGKAMAGKEELSLDDYMTILSEAVAGIQLRGKAVKGEKTMLDALIPAVDAMKAKKEEGADEKAVLEAGVKAAWDGVEYTKGIIATKGRASYLGERSIGHQDPGATSVTMVLETIAGACA